MKKTTMIYSGTALAVIGALVLAFSAIAYPSQEQVVDFGGLEITAETEERIPLPNWAGAIAIAGGVLLLGSAALRNE